MKSSKIFYENGQRYIIYANAILQHLKGNKAPYFSITGEIWKCNKYGLKYGQDCVACGCLHDEIEEHFPGLFSDVIALHLSDMDGTPMHAVENGWYWYQQDKDEGLDYIRCPKELRNYDITDKQGFADLVDQLRPMYRQQADDCIKKHNLEI